MSEQTLPAALHSAAEWAAYYRANVHRFAKEYLGLTLKTFQKINLVEMDLSQQFVWIAARGGSKTFISAVYCCTRCILYPGTKICIVSGTRGQASEVLAKIKLELMPRSPNLCAEIKEIKTLAQDSQCLFYNGSSIQVVTASDNARGKRANVLLVDEFRMVDKDTLDAVLKKFLTVRRLPAYLDNYSSEEREAMTEPNRQMYLSSAYHKAHWAFDKVRDTFVNMLDGSDRFFVCALPYQLSIKEGLLAREDVESAMLESDFNEVSWLMEMEAKFWGDDGTSFFRFDAIHQCRTVTHPMLPARLRDLLPGANKLNIPIKQPGEKRIISLDIALMSSRKNNNDASSIFVSQLIPAKGERYINNVIYTESSEGAHTADQALNVRQLFEEYDCDYLVIDAKGVGAGVVDLLVRDITDPNTGWLYPALSSCNDSEWASRCKRPDAQKALWIINGSAKLNSDCALILREGFRTGKIRLLTPERDGEQALSECKGYSSLSSSDKLSLQIPYIETTLLVNELIHLDHDEASGLIKLSTRGTARKDRYSSLSYNCYVANQLEGKMKPKRSIDTALLFSFRAPVPATSQPSALNSVSQSKLLRR